MCSLLARRLLQPWDCCNFLHAACEAAHRGDGVLEIGTGAVPVRCDFLVDIHATCSVAVAVVAGGCDGCDGCDGGGVVAVVVVAGGVAAAVAAVAGSLS